MIENVIIRNYKSIRELELPLRRLNVLVGSNGVGKTNFISFFEMAKAIFEQRFGSYTLESGGIDNLLYHGRKQSSEIYGLIDFNNTNAFYFNLKPTRSNKGYIDCAGDYVNTGNVQVGTNQVEVNHEGTDQVSGLYMTSTKEEEYLKPENLQRKDYDKWQKRVWDSGVEESSLIEQEQWKAGHLKSYLRSFSIYHFHDTTSTALMRGQCDISDNRFLRQNGSNLASYLYMLQQTDEKAFKLIEGTVSSIAPYFKKFKLRPDPLMPSKISLEWEEHDSDMYLDGYSFSDGTIRFIALATLLLQTNLPEVIIIDEPEIGLHPAAINKLSALIKRASRKSQLIISTQSSNLVNYFEPEDIVVVDREGGQAVFQRLNKEDLQVWMDEYNYTISDMWETNLIGGQL